MRLKAFLILCVLLTCVASCIAQTTRLPLTYNLTVAPSTVPGQVAWESGSYTSINGTTSNIVWTIPLEFTFTIFSQDANTVFLSSEGNLQFGTSSTIGPSAMPTGSALITPYIAFFWSSLSTTQSDQIMYRTEGTAPNRQFTIRLFNANLSPSTGYGNVSLDVVLFETSNTIEVRYFNVPITTTNVVIGIENSGGLRSDGTYDFVVFCNNMGFTQDQATALVGTTVTFTRRSDSIVVPLPLSYNVTHNPSISALPISMPNAVFLPPMDNQMTIPIGFQFVFYGKKYTYVNITDNGDLQFETSDNSATILPMPGAVSRAPFIAAFFTDLYPQCTACRSYTTFGNDGNRTFILRFQNVPYYSTRSNTVPPTASFDVLLYESSGIIELRFYNIQQNTQQVVIGCQGMNVLRADYTFDYTVAYNLVGITSISSELSNSTLLFTPAVEFPIPPTPSKNTSYYMEFANTIVSRPALASLTPVQCSNDGFVPVEFGFSFPFYNVTYDSATLSCNGNFQFLTQENSSIPPTLPITDISLLPLVAFLFTDLNTAASGTIASGLYGDAPARQFHIRFTGVSYRGVASSSLTFDVVLFETGRIEFRYYSMDSMADSTNQSSVATIGIQANSGLVNGTYDYNAFWNSRTIDAAAAANFTGSTLIFQQTPIDFLPPATLPLSYNWTQAATTTSAVPFTSPIQIPGSDEGFIQVEFGFFFSFFGHWYNKASMGMNGALYFGNAVSSRTSGTLPLGNIPNLPILAFFATDLLGTYQRNQRYYETIGSYPNRQFVLHFDRVPFYSCPTSAFVSLDLVLNEVDSSIEIGYGAIGACASATVLIGLQYDAIQRADYSYDYLAIYNGVAATQYYMSLLVNTTVKFMQINTQAPPLPFEPIVNGSYSVDISYGAASMIELSNPVPFPISSVATTPISIGFPFSFYNTTYTTVYASSNGYIQFQSSAVTTVRSSMPLGNSVIVPFVAVFFSDVRPSTTTLQYQVLGQPGYRMCVIRYTDVAYVANRNGLNSFDVVLYEVDNRIEVFYYIVSLSTVDILMGIQASAGDGGDFAAVANDVGLDQYNRWAILNGAKVTYRPIVPLVQTQVGRFQYNMSISPVPQEVSLLHPITLSNLDDATNSYIPIGFYFPFFGILYQYLSISSNGNIQFLTDLIDPWASPLPLSDPQRVPAIFFAWTNLYPPFPNSVRQYQLIGTDISPQFAVRLRNVAFYSPDALSGNSNASTIGVDVILDPSGSIEFRYYHVDPCLLPVQIGIESQVHPDNSTEFYSFHNALPLNATVASQLQGTAVLFTYIEQSVDYHPLPYLPSFPVSSYQQGTYFVTHLKGVIRPTTDSLTSISFNDRIQLNLGFSMPIFGSSYTNVIVDRRGVLLFGNFSGSFDIETLPDTLSGLDAYVSFAYTPFVTSLAGISYVTTGLPTNHTFILRWNDQQYSDQSGYMTTEILLHEQDGVIELRYYNVDPSSEYIMVGINGPASPLPDYSYFVNRAQISSPIARTLTMSTILFTPSPFILPQTSQSSYNYSISELSSLTPPSLANVVDLPTSDDGIDTIPLGFLFTFYGQEYDNVHLDANGEIQFATFTVDYTPDPLPFGNTQLAPFLAYFYTNLYPNYESETSKRQYAFEGSYPHRVFTLRLTNIAYFDTRLSGPAVPSVSLDVKLYEFDGHIEIWYYHIDESLQNVLVGIEGPPYLLDDYSSDYFSLFNVVPVNSSIVSTLAGHMITFTPAIPQQTPRLIGQVSYAVERINGANFEPLTNPSQIPTDDYRVTIIPIGFSFNLYGVNYTVVGVSAAGNLQFNGSNWISNTYAYPMPSNNLQMEPLISFWFVDLTAHFSNTRYYQVLGTEPNRRLVIRFERQDYTCCTSVFNGEMNFDVVLFEADGRIEMRYFTVGTTIGTPVLIGVQNSTSPRSDGVYDYTAYWNALYPTTSLLESLTNATVVLTRTSESNWTGPTLLPLTYNFTSTNTLPNHNPLENPTVLPASSDEIYQVPIGFTFRYFDSYYKKLFVGSNGDIQFLTSYPETIPQPMPFSTNRTLPILAYYFTDLNPINNGSRSYSTTGTFPNKIFTLRLNNVPYAICSNALVSIDVKLYQVDSHIEIIYNRVDSCTYQNILIGVETTSIRRSDYTYDFLAPFNLALAEQSTTSLLEGTMITFRFVDTTVTGAAIIETVSQGSYLAQWVDNVEDPIPLDSFSFVGTGFSAITVPIGFTMQIFGIPYTSFRMTLNGVVQLVSSQFLITSSPIPLSSGTSSLIPFVAFAYSYEFYSSTRYDRYYTTIGDIGSRTFIMRFENVPYMYSTDTSKSASIDFLMFESDYHMEIRVYRIEDTSTQRLLLGLQGSATDYAYVINSEALTRENALILSGSTIVFSLVNDTLSSSSSSTGSSSSSAISSSSSSSPNSFCAYGTPPNGTISIQLLLPIDSTNITEALLTRFLTLLNTQLQLTDTSRTVCGSFTYAFASAPASPMAPFPAFMSRALVPSGNQTLVSLFILDNSPSGPSALEIYSHFNSQAYTSILVQNGLPMPTEVVGSTVCGDIQLSVGTNCDGTAAHDDSNDNLSGGAIAGIVVGVVLGVLLCFLIILYVFKSRKQNSSSDPNRVNIPTNSDDQIDPSQTKADMSVARVGEDIELVTTNIGQEDEHEPVQEDFV